MQYNSNEVTYHNQSNSADNQYPPTNPPSYGTDVYQPYPGPPPYASYSQQSINNTDHTVSSEQRNGQVLLNSQKNVLIIPAHHLLTRTRILTTITLKLQVFFILSGITYLLWSALAIGLEISILLYSYSIYYRGIFSGFIMLGTSISMLIIACRVSYSMAYVVRLLFFVVIFCIVGVILSIVDVTVSQKCANRMSSNLCDTQIGHRLKVIILIELCIATIHTGINLAIVRHIQKKSISIPPVANTSEYQY
ncbi:unnamed protein product [Rotaria sordida]|uniref:Uncharacterized protein n=1 Tax=Rotaria sordida TaxID=392033 RepID=A0A813TNC0_9BILA|nr:unnamed protein product [Rotaria sordida]